MRAAEVFRASDLNPAIREQVQQHNLEVLRLAQEQPGVYHCYNCGHPTFNGPLPSGPPVCQVCVDIACSIIRIRPFMLDHIAWVAAGKPEIRYHE